VACIPRALTAPGDRGGVTEDDAIKDTVVAFLDPLALTLLNAGHAVELHRFGTAAVLLEVVADLASSASRIASRAARP
jgi:hypothetical protein